jgi:hypothetical protein
VPSASPRLHPDGNPVADGRIHHRTGVEEHGVHLAQGHGAAALAHDEEAAFRGDDDAQPVGGIIGLAFGGAVEARSSGRPSTPAISAAVLPRAPWCNMARASQMLDGETTALPGPSARTRSQAIALIPSAAFGTAGRAGSPPARTGPGTESMSATTAIPRASSRRRRCSNCSRFICKRGGW